MKAHSFDPVSFVAGLLFVGLGASGAAGVLDDLSGWRIGWPLILIGFGLLLVVSTIGSRVEQSTGGGDGRPG